MVTDKARISIGMPVFNGERYIQEVLDSILAQTYSDFELIISDNASTDKTQEICRAYQDQDRRISYYRNGKNIGAAKNFNRVFELSSGEYFKWAAHDDIIAPDFLAKCVDILDHDPSVVLCYSGIRFINEYGKVVGNYDIKLESVSSPKPHKRFRDLILIDHLCIQVFGLIRASTLKMTPLIASYIASDRVLLAELGLLGRFYEIPEYLFSSREHQERSIRALPFNFRAAWFDTANTERVVIPHWRFYLEYWKCVRRASLSWYERIYCYLHLGRWFAANLNWARMVADLIIAVEPRSVGLLLKAKEWYYRHEK